MLLSKKTKKSVRKRKKAKALRSKKLMKKIKTPLNRPRLGSQKLPKTSKRKNRRKG